MNDKLMQMAIDAKIQMVSPERLEDFAQRIIAECVAACADVGEDAFATANGQYVTAMGKDIHIAMGMGAKSCALNITNLFKE
jgi:hypothetical protein